jgi:phosphoribosylanthranilate isomerase
MARHIVQVYEIQTPDEARLMIEMGVDHVGSVITSRDTRHDPVIRETVSVVRRLGVVSSLIPLYADAEAVFDTIDYYQPHIIHFCDRLENSGAQAVEAAITLQTAVKRRFPDVRIMRSIPIGQFAEADGNTILSLAARLEPVSDFFLTDTVIAGNADTVDGKQPVAGFVGITGLTCDWSVATQLVACSRIPVILAGGISPENVAEGIRRVGPFGVDSCTCTNAIDGNGRPIRFKKDPARVAELVKQVRLLDGQMAANGD